MKAFIYLFLFFSVAVFAGDSSAVIAEKISNESKLQEELIEKFKEILSIKVNQGDKQALLIADEARKNAGKLNLDFKRMKGLLLLWDKTLAKRFEALPTQEEKINAIKKRFETLFTERVNAKDGEALKLVAHGKKHNGLQLSVKQMKMLIEKWEK